MELLTAEERKDPKSLAHRAKQTNKLKYAEVLQREFGRPDTPSKRQCALARAPFRAYVTLNYDQILQASFELTARKTVEIHVYPDLPAGLLGNPDQCAWAMPQHLLYHIHGKIDPAKDIPNVVLTSEEYEEAYSNTVLRSFLAQMLTYYPICFLGCRVDEDVMLRGVIKECIRIRTRLSAISSHEPPKWYMLIDKDEFAHLDSNLDECGIIPVPFNNSDKKFESLDQILTEWGSMQQARVYEPFEGNRDLYGPNKEPSQ